jgi:DNA-binding transcriptional MerR regulator
MRAMMIQRTYLIGDLAREFDVSLRTLRFYEDRGLLSPTRQGRTRIYSEEDRAQLSRIVSAKKLGFTLTEIDALLSGDSADAQELVLSPEQIETQIAYLERQQAEIAEALADLRARLEQRDTSRTALRERRA